MSFRTDGTGLDRASGDLQSPELAKYGALLGRVEDERGHLGGSDSARVETERQRIQQEDMDRQKFYLLQMAEAARNGELGGLHNGEDQYADRATKAAYQSRVKEASEHARALANQPIEGDQGSDGADAAPLETARADVAVKPAPTADRVAGDIDATAAALGELTVATDGVSTPTTTTTTASKGGGPSGGAANDKGGQMRALTAALFGPRKKET